MREERSSNCMQCSKVRLDELYVLRQRHPGFNIQIANSNMVHFTCRVSITCYRIRALCTQNQMPDADSFNTIVCPQHDVERFSTPKERTLSPESIQMPQTKILPTLQRAAHLCAQEIASVFPASVQNHHTLKLWLNCIQTPRTHITAGS